MVIYRCIEIVLLIFFQAAGGGLGGAQHVSFPYFMAFITLLNNMELVKRIYLNASNENHHREVTKGC